MSLGASNDADSRITSTNGRCLWAGPLLDRQRIARRANCTGHVQRDCDEEAAVPAVRSAVLSEGTEVKELPERHAEKRQQPLVQRQAFSRRGNGLHGQVVSRDSRYPGVPQEFGHGLTRVQTGTVPSPCHILARLSLRGAIAVS